MVRRAYANGDIYLGTYEGWYCPNEGFRNATDVEETARGTICPNHPDVPLQWLTERNWFFRLSAYQERLERHFEEHPGLRPARLPAQRDARLHPRRASRTSRSAAPASGWGIPFPIAENGETAQREDGIWDPEAGTIYVWYDALINYITGAGFPDDLESFEKWWPADLHVIGKDIARFHTIFWPAMLWSAGLEAPRQVWVHGWLLDQGGERMSKSRGNFLDPHDVVAAFGSDGARYVTLREVAVRPRHRGVVGLVRPALQRRPRQRLRQPRQPDGLDGEPLPRRRAARAEPRDARRGLDRAARGVPDGLEGYLLHEALAELWEFVGAANRLVDAEQPWELAKAAKAGDAAARRSACAASSAISSRPAGSSAWPSRRSCRRRRRGSSASSATPTRTARTATAARRSSTSCAGALTRGEPGGSALRSRSSRASTSNPRHPDGAALIPAQRRQFVDAPRRQPLPPPGRPRSTATSTWSIGGARLAGVERILVPGWNPRLVPRRARRWSNASRGSTPRSASIRTTRRRSTTTAGPRSSPSPRTRGWWRSARPGLDYDRVFSPILAQLVEPAAQPPPRARDRQAGDPPLPIGRGRARRPGRAPRRARAAFGERSRRRS